MNLLILQDSQISENYRILALEVTLKVKSEVRGEGKERKGGRKDRNKKNRSK